MDANITITTIIIINITRDGFNPIFVRNGWSSSTIKI
jgi:hypothetical protein